MLTISAAALGLSAWAQAADVPLKEKHPRKAPYAECCEVYRYVYAEAWYGNQKIIAPVRRTPGGDQVQVPGGWWIDCVFSCELTIRKLPMEYWQEQGAGYNRDTAPYPRRDFWTDGWGNRHDYLF